MDGLPLDLGRKDGVPRGRVGPARDSLPRRGLDPHDDISPHHRWGPLDAEDDCPNRGRDCVWSAAALKRALGSRAPSSIRDFTVGARNGSSRVERTRLTGPSGATSISGGDLRSLLGLRSTWFTIGVLRLNGGGSIERGEAARLRALARNLGDVNLQRRRAGSGSWVNVRRISGRVTVSVRPEGGRRSTGYGHRLPRLLRCGSSLDRRRGSSPVSASPRLPAVWGSLGRPTYPPG